METNEFYHVYNRGVAKQPLFKSDSDRNQLVATWSFYLEKEPGLKFSDFKKAENNPRLPNKVANPLVEILAYCLMPNHFHLLVKQVGERGLSTFMRKSLNSYTRYFNTRYDRVGSMFQGTYQAVAIESDEQLVHVSRYIHLNPVVAKLVDQPKDYPWSSYQQYLKDESSRFCSPTMILEMANGSTEYQQFVENYLGYAQELALIKNLLLDTR